ncbi:hypothetical protein LTR86_005903 [Recurvomyces mirabilis]|nr:hypothetical protein LTR86_005903 [Recurvomyces mirabilis]
MEAGLLAGIALLKVFIVRRNTIELVAYANNSVGRMLKLSTTTLSDICNLARSRHNGTKDSSYATYCNKRRWGLSGTISLRSLAIPRITSTLQGHPRQDLWQSHTTGITQSIRQLYVEYQHQHALSNPQLLAQQYQPWMPPRQVLSRWGQDHASTAADTYGSDVSQPLYRGIPRSDNGPYVPNGAVDRETGFQALTSGFPNDVGEAFTELGVTVGSRDWLEVQESVVRLDDSSVGLFHGLGVANNTSRIEVSSGPTTNGDTFRQPCNPRGVWLVGVGRSDTERLIVHGPPAALSSLNATLSAGIVPSSTDSGGNLLCGVNAVIGSINAYLRAYRPDARLLDRQNVLDRMFESLPSIFASVGDDGNAAGPAMFTAAYELFLRDSLRIPGVDFTTAADQTLPEELFATANLGVEQLSQLPRFWRQQGLIEVDLDVGVITAGWDAASAHIHGGDDNTLPVIWLYNDNAQQLLGVQYSHWSMFAPVAQSTLMQTLPLANRSWDDAKDHYLPSSARHMLGNWPDLPIGLVHDDEQPSNSLASRARQEVMQHSVEGDSMDAGDFLASTGNQFDSLNDSGMPPVHEGYFTIDDCKRARQIYEQLTDLDHDQTTMRLQPAILDDDDIDSYQAEQAMCGSGIERSVDFDFVHEGSAHDTSQVRGREI